MVQSTWWWIWDWGEGRGEERRGGEGRGGEGGGCYWVAASFSYYLYAASYKNACIDHWGHPSTSPSWPSSISVFPSCTHICKHTQTLSFSLTLSLPPPLTRVFFQHMCSWTCSSAWPTQWTWSSSWTSCSPILVKDLQTIIFDPT